MAQQFFSAGDTGLTVREVIDDNFTELYNTYLPLAGGSLTGPLNTTIATQNKQTTSITSQTLTLNLSASSFFVATLNSNISTIVLQNTPASPAVYSFALQFNYTSSTVYTITWGSAFKWAGGVAPTLTYLNGKNDLLTFLTYDGGTTWFSFVSELNQ